MTVATRDGDGDAEDLPPEVAWHQRLKYEAGSAGDFGGGFGETYDAAGATADADGWDAWAGEEWRTPHVSASHAQERRETEDEFAQRIWQEMERRKGQHQQSIFRCPLWLRRSRLPDYHALC